jgi:hypothetical protein
MATIQLSTDLIKRAKDKKDLLLDLLLTGRVVNGTERGYHTIPKSNGYNGAFFSNSVQKLAVLY